MRLYFPKTSVNKTTTFSSYSQEGKVFLGENIFRGETVKKKHRVEGTMHKLIREEAKVLRGAHTMSSGDRGRCNGEHVVCRDAAVAVMKKMSGLERTEDNIKEDRKRAASEIHNKLKTLADYPN